MRTSVVAAFAVAAFSLCAACVKDSYPVFSTKYKVQFSCDMSQPPFRQAADTPGRFITVRRTSGKLIVSDPDGSSTDVELTRQQDMTFRTGLAGLILGKPTFNNENNEVWAYDLGCPQCDAELYRLSVSVDGMATCSHCSNSWNLNNGGFPATNGVRTLYRYPTSAFGQDLTVSN